MEINYFARTRNPRSLCFFYVMAAWLWVKFDVDEAHFKGTLNFWNQKCDGERNQKNSLFRKSFNCI